MDRESVVGAAVIIGAAVLGLGTWILSLLLGIREHRQAARAGWPRFGAVGLAARIWAWQQLVGSVAAFLMLGGFLAAMIVLAANAPRNPPKEKQLITRETWQYSPSQPGDGPAARWGRLTSPPPGWAYDQDYNLVRLDDVTPRRKGATR